MGQCGEVVFVTCMYMCIIDVRHEVLTGYLGYLSM